VGHNEAAVSELLRRVKEGDMVITLGAGDVYKVGERFLEVLEKA